MIITPTEESENSPTTAPAMPDDIPRTISTPRPRDFATLKLISHNVNGLRRPEKLEILSRYAVINSIDVMCLQETWREGKYTIDIPTIDNKSCTLIHYGPAEQTCSRGSCGVAFLLNPSGKSAWIRAGSHPPDYLPSTDNSCRTMGIRLSFFDNRKNKINYYVITSYFPDSSKHSDIFDSYLDSLSDFHSNIPADHIVIEGADINANIGSRFHQDKECPTNFRHIGPFASSPRPNERGTKILNFLQESSLTATTTWFEKPKYDTHYNFLTKQSMQLDHVFTTQKNLKTVIDSGRTSSPINSDHLPIKTSFRIAFKISSRYKHNPKQSTTRDRKRKRKTNWKNNTDRRTLSKAKTFIDRNLLKNSKSRYNFKSKLMEAISTEDDLDELTTKIQELKKNYYHQLKNKINHGFYYYTNHYILSLLNVIQSNYNSTTLQHITTDYA